MPAPSGSSDLTGATRYRNGWRGVLVLQVEERKVAYMQGCLAPGVEREPVYSMQWRDATTKDLRVLEYLDRRERARNEGSVPPPPPDRMVSLTGFD